VETLCRFSAAKGILPKNTTTGDMIQIEANSMNKTATLKTEAEKLNSSQRVSHGLYYRVPDKANIAFKVGGMVKLETRFLVNQFGVVTFLPATSISNIGIDNNTGTLRHVVLE
jgi:hypothetical protein